MIQYRGEAFLKLQFLGVGTQSSSQDQYHSNMVITTPSGKRMLVDCGSDVRFSLAEINLLPGDIDAVYISHLHADHIGGLEWLAFNTYFNHKVKKNLLFCEKRLLERLWKNSLKGGLECIGGKCMQLSDYFNCHPLEAASAFKWEGINFKLVEMLHIPGTRCESYSYGLLVDKTADREKSFFISTDTMFQPQRLEKIAESVDVIFHDCETSEKRSTVHAHYDQLCTLPESVKQKIWLYHYEPHLGYNPRDDGFRGFVVKGQEFSFPPLLT